MRAIAQGLDIIRRRADFVAATRDAIKIGGPLVGLQMRDRDDAAVPARLGVTVTKRVGDSVERSRMKRRLRAAARAGLAPDARAGCDYVLIARRAVLDAPFERLVRDVAEQAKRAHGRAGRRPSQSAGATPAEVASAAPSALAIPSASAADPAVSLNADLATRESGR